MKKLLILLAGIIYTNVYCQCSHGPFIYSFADGKKIEFKGQYYLVPTSADFLSGKNLEEADKIEIQWDGLQIRANKESKKHKYEDLQPNYWGFVFANSMFCRLYVSDPDGKKPYYGYTTISMVGRICVYGSMVVDDPKKTEAGYAYNYCYTDDGIKISLGIDGELHDLTSKNFFTLVGQVSEDLSTKYNEEFNNLGKVKPDKPLCDSKEAMKLFIKYFEMANNLKKE